MNVLTNVFMTVAVLLGVVLIILVFLQGRLWLKICGLVFGVALLALVYVGGLEILGRPKPVELEWLLRNIEKAEVRGSDIQDGESITIMLKIEGVAEDRLVILKWDKKLAEQLQSATTAVQQKGGKVIMKKPFKKGKGIEGDGKEGKEGDQNGGSRVGSNEDDYDDSTFYPEPPKPSPPKNNTSEISQSPRLIRGFFFN